MKRHSRSTVELDLLPRVWGQVDLPLLPAAGATGRRVPGAPVRARRGAGPGDWVERLVAGSAPNANNFERITGAGFPEGAAVATDDSVLQGYGIEGITGVDARRDVVARTMQYLLR